MKIQFRRTSKSHTVAATDKPDVAIPDGMTAGEIAVALKDRRLYVSDGSSSPALSLGDMSEAVQLRETARFDAVSYAAKETFYLVCAVPVSANIAMALKIDWATSAGTVSNMIFAAVYNGSLALSSLSGGVYSYLNNNIYNIYVQTPLTDTQGVISISVLSEAFTRTSADAAAGTHGWAQKDITIPASAKPIYPTKQGSDYVIGGVTLGTGKVLCQAADTSALEKEISAVDTKVNTKSAGSMSLSGSVLTLTAVDGSDTLSTVNLSATVDTAMSDTSTNAVQNKTIKTYIDSKSAGSMSLSGSVLTLTAVDGSGALSTVTLPAPDTALDTASANTVENKVVALAINSINTQLDGLAAAINTITGA